MKHHEIGVEVSIIVLSKFEEILRSDNRTMCLCGSTSLRQTQKNDYPILCEDMKVKESYIGEKRNFVRTYKKLSYCLYC